MNLGKGLNLSHFKRVISFFEVSKFTLNLDTLHLLVTINKVLQVDTSLTLSMTMQNKYSVTLGKINRQDKSV